jgi:hypothetical protein
VDKWAALLYLSNPLAKRRMSLCQTSVEKSQNSSWLSDSSQY